MDENIRLTDEMIEQAKQVSLTFVAQSLGFTPKKMGQNYSLKEMDSMRIYHDRTWNRFSGKGTITGGSTIDFMMEFGNCSSFRDAVRQLLGMQGIVPRTEVIPSNNQTGNAGHYTHNEHAEKKDLILPEPAQDNKRLYAYLMKSRGLSKKVVDYFVRDKKLLYEDREHHNLVFLGKDSEGNVRYAAKRGTYDADSRKYRGDVSGSDKTYGVHISNPKSQVVKVFESCIDMMSYMDLTNDYESSKVALGMLSDAPLLRFLGERPDIEHICFCLDNDEPARKAIYGYHKTDKNAGHVSGLYEKFASVNYKVTVEQVPTTCGKDFNEYLMYKKDLTVPAKKEQPEKAAVKETSAPVQAAPTLRHHKR